MQNEEELLRALIQKGYLKVQHVQQGRQIQMHYSSQGKGIPSLSQILIQKGYLNQQHWQSICKMASLQTQQPQQMTATTPRVAQERPKTGQFDRYNITTAIGKGGMGTVYKVEDPKLNRYCALKVINNQNLSEKERKRFEREAQMMAKLHHPNIVQIFDIGNFKNYPFFTMELIEGDTLSSVLQEDISNPKLIQILIQVAKAVHYAHTEGIIHRDLKPSNIMLDHNQNPKVMDFGLAKEVSETKQVSHTQDVVGTPAYMSPEQAQGKTKNLDATTDVYSLGVILYEIIVGQTPFSEHSTMNMLYHIVYTEPPLPSHQNPNIAIELESICMKAIEKDKNDRYPNTLEFAEDLQRYLEGKTVLARPITWKVRLGKWMHRHRYIVGSVAAAIFVFITVTLVLLQEAANQEEKAKKQAEKVKEQQSIAAKQQKIAAYQKNVAEMYRIENKLRQLEQNILIISNKLRKNSYNSAWQLCQKAQNELQQLKIPDKAMEGLEKTYQRVQRRYEAIYKALKLIEHYGIRIHPYIAKSKQYGFYFADTVNPSPDIVVTYKENRYHKSAQVLSLTTDRVIKQLHISPQTATFSETHKFLAVGGKGQIIIIDLKSKKDYPVRLPNEEDIHQILFSPGNKFLVAISKVHLYFYNFKTRQLLHIEKYDRRHHKIQAAFSKNGRFLALGGAPPQQSVRLIDMKRILSKDQSYQHQKFTVFGESVCFGPKDGSLIIAGFGDIFIYPLFRHKDKSRFIFAINKAHRGQILRALLSPKQDMFVSIGEDGRVVFWSTHNYQKLFEFTISLVDYSISASFNHDQSEFFVFSNQQSYRFFLKDKEFLQEDPFPHPWAKISPRTNIITTALKNYGTKYIKVASSPSGRYSALQFELSYICDWQTLQTKKMSKVVTLQSKEFDYNQSETLLSAVNYGPSFVCQLPSGTKELTARHDLFVVGDRILELEKKPTEVSVFWKKYSPSAKEWILDQKTRISSPTHWVGFSKNKSYMMLSHNESKIYKVPSFEHVIDIPIGCHSDNIHADFAEDGYMIFADRGQVSLIDWKKGQILHQFTLEETTNNAWYDSKRKLFWIRTSSSFYIYPVLDPETIKEYEHIYPIPVFSGYPITDADFDHDFQMYIIRQSRAFSRLRFKHP